MPEMPRAKLQVGLLADDRNAGARLRSLLEDRNLAVAAEVRFSDWPALDFDEFDVCLVELGSRPVDTVALSALVEAATAPLLFNTTQNNFSDESADELARKLTRLAANRMVPRAAKPSPEAAVAPLPENKPDLRVIELPVAVRRQLRQRVWVLAASLGGPGALKGFFAELSEQCSDTFLVAQHIGAGHESLLARQLASVSHREVRVASAGMQLGPGEIIVLPATQEFTVDSHGALQQARVNPDTRHPYRPSADAMMFCVAQAFGENSGAIVFSGMGDDGRRGISAIHEAGGRVYAQAPDSCAISVMPDAARESGLVSASGSAAELASRVAGSSDELAIPG